MTQSNSVDYAAGAIRILELFANGANVEFDRTLAARTLAEATRAIPGDNWPTWGRRLVEVGESLNLRIRTVDCSVDDALTLVQSGIPVALSRVEENGAMTWLAILEVKNKQVRVSEPQSADHEQWIPTKALYQFAHFDGRDSHRWVIAQPALPCDTSSRFSSDPTVRPASPFSRLLALIQPERSDLWAVLIFSIVVGILALATPIAIEALVNTVAFGRYLQPVFVLAFMLLTFMGFAAAIKTLITYVVEIIQRRLFIRVVEDLAYRLPRVQSTALDDTYGPELVNRFFDIVNVQKVAAKLLLDGVTVILQTIIGMIVLAFYHPFLLGFDLVLVICIGFVIFILGRGAVKTAIKESKTKYAIEAWLEELIRHPTAFKFHSGAQFGLDRADKLAVDYLNARKKHFRILLRQIIFALALQTIAATTLLGLGGWLVIRGELTLGQLVAAELIVMIIVGSFAKAGKYLESFYDLMASVDKLGALFDLPIEQHDRLFHLQADGPARLKLESVTFNYGPNRILSGLSCDIAPGERVGITGAAGSGKSLLVDLLCGLRNTADGHIELDEVDLRELRPDSLREEVSLARGIEIFNGTIAENVHLNRRQIDARDVREALQAVGLLNELLDLPDGLETMLQTGGSPLTHSQSLRLMLARALAGRPRLLVIDGTLDSLPQEVLEKTLDFLVRPKQPWTMAITSVRTEVLEKMDKVVVLGKQPQITQKSNVR